MLGLCQMFAREVYGRLGCDVPHNSGRKNWGFVPREVCRSAFGVFEDSERYWTHIDLCRLRMRP